MPGIIWKVPLITKLLQYLLKSVLCVQSESSTTLFAYQSIHVIQAISCHDIAVSVSNGRAVACRNHVEGNVALL